jgi:hypothetical protein
MRSTYLVLHSVTAPARVSRAVFPLIQNSMPLSTYLPPSAEGACGSETLSPLPAKVSRTDPDGPQGNRIWILDTYCFVL